MKARKPQKPNVEELLEALLGEASAIREILQRLVAARIVEAPRDSPPKRPLMDEEPEVRLDNYLDELAIRWDDLSNKSWQATAEFLSVPRSSLQKALREADCRLVDFQSDASLGCRILRELLLKRRQPKKKG